jgi:hypothetical protein
MDDGRYDNPDSGSGEFWWEIGGLAALVGILIGL